MKKKITYLLIGLAALLVLAVGGFVVWAESALPASPRALQAVQSSQEVAVKQVKGWTVFSPTQKSPETGFIFYPGGRVDYRAYAPALNKIAASGCLVVLTPVPLNLAFFGASQANEVLAAFPEIKTWALGGHSLGGTAASIFVYDNPGKINGLVLWASYPAGSNNLSGRKDLKVLSISGSKDGLATPEKINAARPLLPADHTQWLVIEGGNHAQFGSYGFQPGDNAAGIGEVEQQDQVAAATVIFLQSLSGK
jgi:hypothetical protein